MRRAEACIELQQYDRERERGKWRQVVAEPPARNAKEQDAQDCRGDGDPELHGRPVGVP